MRFDFGKDPSRKLREDDKHRVTIRFIPSEVTRRFTRFADRHEYSSKPLLSREEPIDPRSICSKAVYNPENGSFSVTEDAPLLHMLMRYLAARFTLEQLAQTISAQSGESAEAYIANLQDRFGKVRTKSICVDDIFMCLELEAMGEGEKILIARDFQRLLDQHPVEKLICALSPEEVYYTAALRKMMYGDE